MTAQLVFAVIGSPITHSKSPQMHQAAYAALGLPHRYESVETSEVELEARIASLRAGVYGGMNVTVPHKQRVLGLMDEIDESALGVGAANTIVCKDGILRGHNTDAVALGAELLRLAGRPSHFQGGAAIVLGSGGAARAAVLALVKSGIHRIVVRARAFESPERAAAFTRSFPDSLATGARVETGLLEAPVEELADVRAIIQATSCGMGGGPPGNLVADAISWAAIPTEAIAFDVVYTPRDTLFLEGARSRGLRSDGGLGMLARQGALAFSLWLGGEPPFDVMLAAL